jgi:hypothetical protein
MQQGMYQRPLGTFRVESGQVRVTDPCYCPTPRESRGNVVLEHGDGILVVPALNGTWFLTGVMGDGTVMALMAFHESQLQFYQRGERAGKLLVDSGQMGIFDDAQFPREESQFNYEDDTSFYKRACGLTWSEKEERLFGGCLPYGGVTSSGYGDGTYPAYVHTDATGLALSVTVMFDEEDEGDDDDDYDDDDDEEAEDDEDDDDEEEPDDDGP